MTTIAITGASGQLGRHTVENLLYAGTPAGDVVAIVRDPSKVTDFEDRGIQVRRADYSDASTWQDALTGIDRLLLISISGPGASEQHGTVIDAAVAAGVGHLLYTSILKADTSRNALAVEHLKTEKLIAASGLPATILRNGFYHELYTNFPPRLPHYLATGTVTGATNGGRISGAPAADYAAAAAAVLRQDILEPQIHELGGNAFSLDDLADTISAVSKTTVTHTNLSPEDFADALRTAGLDEGYIQPFVLTDESIAAGDLETDSTALADLIGRRTTPLADSVRKAL